MRATTTATPSTRGRWLCQGRMFSLGSIGNWLEYRDQDAFAKCDVIWKEYMSDLIKGVPQFAPKISPNRGIVMYDFTEAEEE